MASLVQRAIGAARLDPATYEDVEADAGALGQALAIVVLSSVASGIGQAGLAGSEGPGLVGGTIVTLISWLTWAFVTYLVGTRLLPTAETRADLGQLLRTIGFSASPGLLGFLGAIPAVGGLVLIALAIWQLAAMVVAVRQALDYTSTGRALAVCAIGLVAYVLVSVLLMTLLIGGLVAIGGGAGGPAGAMP